MDSALSKVLKIGKALASVAELVAGNGEIAAQAWPGEPDMHRGVRRGHLTVAHRAGPAREAPPADPAGARRRTTSPA